LPFAAGVQVTSIDNGDQIAGRTKDLTLFGCFVETSTPFVGDTKIALRISHNSTVLVVQGRVAYARIGEGMGIHFTPLEPSIHSILDDWLAELTVT
jgi:hypothetical protein